MDGGQGKASELSVAKAKLRADGWCVVRDVLTPTETRDALDRLWKAAEESRRRGVDTYMPVLDPNPSNIRVFNLLDIDPVFRDLIRHPRALELVRSLLGEAFPDLQLHRQYREAPARGRWRCTPTRPW